MRDTWDIRPRVTVKFSKNLFCYKIEMQFSEYFLFPHRFDRVSAEESLSWLPWQRCEVSAWPGQAGVCFSRLSGIFSLICFIFCRSVNYLRWETKEVELAPKDEVIRAISTTFLRHSQVESPLQLPLVLLRARRPLHQRENWNFLCRRGLWIAVNHQLRQLRRTRLRVPLMAVMTTLSANLWALTMNLMSWSLGIALLTWIASN